MDFSAYEYYLDGDLMEFFEEFGFAMIGIVLGILLVALLVGLVFYVLQSVALYSIAKRRGINNAWLAWIPVGTNWIMGSISDQYQYVVNGKIKNKRKIMLILSLCPIAINLIARVVSTALLLASVGSSATEVVMVSSAVTAVQSVVNAGFSIALAVYGCIALYDLYTSCCPNNNVLFLVLGIIFSFLTPFFLFFNRKRDDGMPPRRPDPVTYTYQEPVANESWQAPEQQ